jgi:two-component system NtrC family sensor kinase
LTFSRTGKNDVEKVDVDALLRETVPLLETRARLQGTGVEVDLGPGSFEVVANRTQLQQVIVNLGNNALDAVGSGGSVRLGSRYGADGLTLEVEDTGPGIPEAIRGNIFDPFFTTKEVGQGTGLGLSLVHEIVHQHGGSIEVVDRQERGTLMRVTVPMIRAPQRRACGGGPGRAADAR